MDWPKVETALAYVVFLEKPPVVLMSESPEFFHESELVSVLTTQPIDRVLDYKAPEGGCFLGAFVEVPLGPRKVLGVVWGAGQGGYDPAKIRSVSRVLDVAPMTRALREFLIRAGEYTLTPLSVSKAHNCVYTILTKLDAPLRPFASYINSIKNYSQIINAKICSLNI